MKFNQNIFFERIANVHLLTWGYFSFHLFSMVTMRMFLNADSIVTDFDFWLAIFALEHAFIFGLYALARPFIKHYTIWLVLGSTLAMGFARTVLTTGLALHYNIGARYEWGFQLVTGALFEVALVVVWASVNGSYRDHRALVNLLNYTRDQVLGYRENAEEILAEEQEKLQALTRESLQPQIQMIENAINQANLVDVSRWSAAAELKALINNQVRPLSASLRESARQMAKPAVKAPNHFFSVVALPRRFRITNSIFPKASYLLMFLSFAAAPFWTLDSSWIPISILISPVYWAILLGIKKLTSNWPPIPNYLGAVLLVVIALLPVLPNYAFAVWFYPEQQQGVLYGLTITWASLLTVTSIALLDSFDYGSRKYREVLEAQNHQLSLEMTLFEQQVWAARRSWSLVVHGSVQASLTAALTRLSSPQTSKQNLALAKKDLERAMAALSSTPKFDLKLSSAIKELVATWQGVCDITVEIAPELKRQVSKDARLSMCINEILKEAISNAVRHGDAQTASIDLRVTQDGLIELKVANDGKPPVLAGRKGLGSALLDELTLDWQLSVDENRDQTVLLAHLPFSGSQA